MADNPADAPDDIAQSGSAEGQVRPRYERRDVAFTRVLPVMIVAILLAGVDLYAVWRLFQGERQHFDDEYKPRYPLVEKPGADLPLPPRLEQLDRLAGNENVDLYRTELVRARQLSTYGPTGEDGFVHILIEQAMDLVVDRLPVRHDVTSAGKDRGLVDHGESNSGRMLRGPRR